jgi:hypothetical protein
VPIFNDRSRAATSLHIKQWAVRATNWKPSFNSTTFIRYSFSGYTPEHPLSRAQYHVLCCKPTLKLEDRTAVLCCVGSVATTTPRTTRSAPSLCQLVTQLYHLPHHSHAKTRGLGCLSPYLLGQALDRHGLNLNLAGLTDFRQPPQNPRP